VPAEALADDAHATAVAGRLEGDAPREDGSRRRVEKQGEPRLGEILAAAAADELEVELRVVDVTDLERPLAVAGRRRLEVPLELLEVVDGLVAVAGALDVVALTPR
jgi:hypothetical protein